MLACKCSEQTWYIDPFDRGELMDYSECRSRIEGMLDPPAVLDEVCFRRATTGEIAVRVLRNLKAAYAMADRWQDALPVQERLVLLLPDEPSEQRDLGLIYLRTSAAHQALETLERYAKECTANDEATIEPYLRTARRMVAELN
jgi:regulator of sirC expression with transglutaminase-like and TPR domain